MSRPSRLPVVLRLAQLEAREALRVLGLAQRRLAELDAAHVDLLNRRERARHACVPAPYETTTPYTLMDHQRHVAVLGGHIAEIELARIEASQEETRARRRVAEKRVRVRALERAIAQREARDRRERSRREARLLDDRVAKLQEDGHAQA